MQAARAFQRIHTGLKAQSRRLGVWLAVVAMLAQMLVPLSHAQAAWAEDGLFPPACATTSGSDDGSGDAGTFPPQCPCCQVHLGDHLTPPLRIAEPAFARIAILPSWPDLSQSVPVTIAASPPLPSRGPPSAA